MLGSVTSKMTAFGAALVMSVSPALASSAAAPAAPRQISPMVALSIFGSQASATALCGASATTTSSTSAAVQAPVGGCVLPVVDAPPPLPVAEALPLIPAAGIGIAPILVGLSSIAVLTALIAGQKNGNNSAPPISVN